MSQTSDGGRLCAGLQSAKSKQRLISLLRPIKGSMKSSENHKEDNQYIYVKVNRNCWSSKQASEWEEI